jgi:hypothetical protein
MKTFTIKDLRKWRPCYDPNKFFPEKWEGTALDILLHPLIPAKDKLWVVLRTQALDLPVLRIVVVSFARALLNLLAGEADPNIVSACDIAEKYANNQASAAELKAASASARALARAATVARDKALGTKMEAALDSAEARELALDKAWASALDPTAERNEKLDAIWASAWAVAWATARDTNLNRERIVVWDSATVAMRNAAWDETWAAAWSLIWDTQVSLLLELLNEDKKERTEFQAQFASNSAPEQRMEEAVKRGQ